MFHWTDNLFFGRRQDGSVRVLKFGSDWRGGFPAADAPAYPDAVIDKIVPAAEWASITSSVSRSGETSETYQRAVELHG